jgi:hypothetical protein
MKIGKKLMVMIIGLNLAGAGILGGIILQISQRKMQDRDPKEFILPEKIMASETGQNTAGPRMAANIPQRISKTPIYRLLTISATVGGFMIILITAIVFITARKDVGKEDPALPPETAGNTAADNVNKKDNACTIKQITVSINDLNKELDRQAESIVQSTLAIERMLTNIRSVTKTLAHDKDEGLNGTQGGPHNHVPLVKQIQDEYRD